jgi:hypothetical protein
LACGEERGLRFGLRVPGGIRLRSRPFAWAVERGREAIRPPG